MLVVGSADGDDVRPLPVGETRDVSLELVERVALVDVEIKHCTAVHLGITVTSRLVRIIIQYLLKLHRLPLVILEVVGVYINGQILS